MTDPQPVPVPDGETDRIDRLRLLVDSVVDYAIFTLEPDGTVSSWNRGARRLKGYAADEIIGRHFSAFYTEPDLAAGKPFWELTVAAEHGRFEDEGWRLRNDGTRFWANVIITALRDESGELVGFGKVTRDLTERKLAEDALRASEERFRLLVESVVDYAIFMLEPDGRIASWNLGAQRLKGYRAEEIVGRHFSTFYTEPDRAAGNPQRLLDAAMREGRVEQEGWRVRKDGSRCWADVVITALRDADGVLRGYSKVTRDLTDRKRAEDALRDALDREQAAADRLRELDSMRRDLSAIVAHDLRSPMAVITGLTSLLLDDWDRLDDGKRRDYVTRVDRTVTGLRRIVDDILDVARLEAGELVFATDRFDLEAIVRRAVSELIPIDAPERVRFEVEPELPWAVGDERRTWQVVSNLLSNALRFGRDEPVVVELWRDGTSVRVSVRDRGPGIPEDQLGQLFERYTRLGRGGGAGLGLHIARSFVEGQGGEIGVQSTVGQGSTFWFRLPAAPDAA